MRKRARLFGVAAVALAILPISGIAQTRSNALVIRASVVPTCAIVSGADGTIAMTCSRGGASAGVITQSGDEGQKATRVVAVPARTATVVSAQPVDATTDAYAAPEARSPRQVVTVNF